MFDLNIPAQADTGLDDACGADPGGLCEWVYDATDSFGLARAADWLIDKPLTAIIIVLVAAVVAWVMRRVLRRLVRRAMTHDASSTLARTGVIGEPADDPRREARAQSISEVVGGTAAVVIWIVAVFAIVAEFGIDLGPVFAAAGIAGVALGFGAQSMVKDFLAGFFVLVEDQYGIGDVVDLGEASGTVQQITLRATVLRSLDGTVWHVPNGEVQRVGNQSQIWSVAIVDVTVSYDTDLEHAQAVILQAATALCESAAWKEEILDAPEVLGIEGLGSLGVNVRTVVKTTPGQQFALQRALREAVKSALDAAGIAIPVQRLQ